MPRLHGKNGVIYLAPTFGAQASPLSFAADWTINAQPARPDITTIPDPSVTYGGAAPPDYSGDFSGWFDDATAMTYLAATDGLPRNWYLYPSAAEPWRYFYGLILPDFSTGAGVGSAVAFKATWNASGPIGASPSGLSVASPAQAGTLAMSGGPFPAEADGALHDAPAAFSPDPATPLLVRTRPQVTLLAGPGGQFYTLPQYGRTATGHPYRTRTVPGWAWGNGIELFYTRAMPDGQVLLTSVPMTENELQPTGTTAEICAYNPVTGDFYRQVLPTSAGALTAANPTSGYGGTDVGGGDIVQVTTAAGTKLAICTCEGYYFGWPILTTGLYPTFAKFAKSGSPGRWLFLPIAVNFLTGQNAGFEGGIGTWLANVNCSVAGTSAQAHTGSSSLGITSAAAGDMIAASVTSASITSLGLPCAVNQSILVSAWVRSAVSVRACSAGIAFYDVNGVAVGSTLFGPAANDSTSAWTQISGVFTVPATAAFARALIKVAATGGAAELHYADDVTFMQIDAQSLTGDQWELTNPALFQSVIGAGGQSSGNGANYWGTRGIGQMAVLPASGSVVIGHYFDTGSGTNAGCLSVIAPDGSLQAAFQIPTLTPNSGTITSASVRDVEADPTGVLGDERFVIMYDTFGTGAATTHCFQEFSYNATGHSTILSNGVTVGAGSIAPVSAPCLPADGTVVDCSFCVLGPDGSLYVTTFQSGGLAAGNLQVYIKPPGGMRAICNVAPATGTWASTGWQSKVAADYSLNFPAAQGLGSLNGPPVVDKASNAILIPGASGVLGTAAPNSIPIGGTGPNLLSAFASGFEPPNALLVDDQIFAGSLGTWNPFLGSFTGPSVPPVAPPVGTKAMHCVEAFSSLTGQSARYSVTQNTTYKVVMNFLATTTVRVCEVYQQWYNAAGTVLGTSTHSTASDSASAWTQIINTATTPAGTTGMVIFFIVDSAAASEVHWVASCALYNLGAVNAGWTGFITNVAITDAQALDGQHSLAIIAPFNNETLDALSPSLPVSPFGEYRCQAWFRAAATPQPCKLVLNFRDSGGNLLSQVGGGSITDSTSAWTMAQVVAMAPARSATVQINAEPTTTVTNETHYIDRVSLVQQPWTPKPSVDFLLNKLRAVNGGNPVSIGRPALIWPYLYVPIGQGLTSAETTAYGSNSYTPAPKPQYLAAIDLSQIMAS